MENVTHTFNDLVLSFGGTENMAKVIGVGRTAVCNWSARRRVPPCRWSGIVDAAERLGIPGITYSVLRNLQFVSDMASRHTPNDFYGLAEDFNTGQRPVMEAMRHG